MNKWLLVLAAAFSAAPANAGTLFGVTVGNPAVIHTIDPATAISTPVATLSGAAPQSYWSGLEYYNGLLYGIGFGASGDPTQLLTTFVSIDPATGTTAILGAVPDTVSERYAYALAVNAATGLFYTYGDNGNQLYSVTMGGVFTPIGGGTGVDWFDGLAFDPSAGVLYGVTDANSPAFDLYRIDPATGQQTSIGSLGVNLGEFSGLAFDPDTESLYLASSGGAGTALYSVSRSTGAATFIGANPLTFTGLAAATVPEPASFAMAAGAFAILLLVKLKA